METLDPDDTVYQLFTVVDDQIIPSGDAENNLVQITSGNQVFYLTLPKQVDEVEEEEDTSTALVNLPKDETFDYSEEQASHFKLITLENGDVYLTDGTTEIQPHFMTNLSEKASQQAQEATTETNGKFRGISFDNGMCALINTSMWDSVVEPAPEKKAKQKMRYPCTFPNCNKSFSLPHHMEVHKRTHTGIKPFSCRICGKSFSTGYSLKAHTRIHTGEKPYGCAACFKQFKTSGDLQKHIRTHTGEKPFRCPIEGCDKSFTTSNIQKVHIRSHTGERPYSCSECGKAFASATNYKNHMRIHSGEKPYVCPIESCGKRFTEYSSLYKHNTVHQPHKKYRCDYCNQDFKLQNLLDLHNKSDHGVFEDTNGIEYVLSGDISKPVLLLPSENNEQSLFDDSWLLQDDEDSL